MFDPTTSDLIRQAPALGGLDLARLPEELTRTYTEIVSARLAQQQANPELLDRFRRLANAYRALSVLLPDSPQRRAAAFVAGSAHVLLHQAAAGRHRSEPQQLMRNAVAHEIAAVLLFVIAEQFPDAAAVAVRIAPPPASSVAHILTRAIVALGTGDMARVEALPPPAGEPGDLTLADAALNELWSRLLAGVRRLAGAVQGKRGVSFESAAAAFDDVWNESVQASAPLADFQLVSTFVGFAGPHQLAGLLRGAAGAIARASLTSVPPPSGTDEKAWRRYVRRASARRPFLWSNHLEAVRQGYLDTGVSAVLTFPTGAGKSALSELKIATAVSRARDVVFLAPTHALVSQTVRDMRRAFPGYEVSTSFVEGGEYAELEDTDAGFVKGSIVVMTPERCLTMASLNPELFARCGLVVFDEFHLMHPTQPHNLRRSIDATLCVLQLLECAPDADVVLISAMLANAKDIAAWVEKVTKRRCIPLDIRWKPTRQARGCVVYEKAALTGLQQTLNEARRGATKKAPGHTELMGLRARPFALMCLEQTWNTMDEHDYTLVPVSADNTALSANKFWKLAPNRNGVARDLAAGLGNARMKTIVFVQKLDATFQIAEACAPLLNNTGNYSPEDRRLVDAIEQDVGSSRDAFLPFDIKAACHHSLMTPEERELVEQMFRREKDLSVLVATATLAQGMNLPAEAVIMAGDDRFDVRGGAEMLAAHELLNAAGRAGRAGQMPQGVVLVVPSRVVGVDLAKLEIDQRWHELRENVLSQADQCLEVQDPIQRLLDAIHLRAKGELQEDIAAGDLEYFVQRLPVGGQDRTSSLLHRSLSGFFAHRNNTTQQFEKHIEEALAYRRELWGEAEPLAELDWREDAAARMGVPLWVIDSIQDRLKSFDSRDIGDVGDWIDVICAWLNDKPLRVFLLHRIAPVIDSFAEALNQGKASFTQDEETARLVIELIRKTTKLWIRGATLKELEKSLAHKPKRYCMRARQFTLRFVPELSYTVGLFAFVARRLAQLQNTPEHMSLALATAATCVREGVDDPRKLALREIARGVLSRVAVHASFMHIEAGCPAPAWNENYRVVKDSVRQAYEDTKAGPI